MFVENYSRNFPFPMPSINTCYLPNGNLLIVWLETPRLRDNDSVCLYMWMCSDNTLRVDAFDFVFFSLPPVGYISISSSYLCSPPRVKLIIGALVWTAKYLPSKSATN